MNKGISIWKIRECCVQKFCFSDIESFISAFCTDHWAPASLLASVLKILTCFCYTQTEFFTGCQSTECMWRSKEPPPHYLVFCEKHHSFYLWESQCISLFSSVCGLLLRSRRKLFCCCRVFTSFMSPANEQKCLICAPLCHSDKL